MPLLLSLETATNACSIAVHNEDQLVVHTDFIIDKAHGTVLTPTIQFLLEQSGFKFSDITAIAVSKGPGSYTGLRIGVSVAKGICYSLDIPLISVNTLQVMAMQVRNYVSNSEILLCPMIDARRMEVYTAVFDHNLKIIEPVQALVVDSNSFQALLEKKKIVFFGNGASKCKHLLPEHRNASFLENVYPSARWLGTLANQKLAAKQFEDLNTFEPFYLKEFTVTKSKL